MNKRSLLIIPICLLLSGCFDIKLTKESHDAGLYSNGTQIYGTFSYGSYSGLSIDKEGKTAVEVNSKIDITTLGFSDAEAVKNYLIDNEGIITSVSQYSELAMNNKGLRIGDAKKEIRGSLTLTLSRPVSAVEIVAYPFSTTHDTLHESELVVDQDVRLDVNSLGFLSVSSELNENEVIATTCGFALNGSTQTIQITCGPNRAVISKLIFYY